MIFDNLKLCSYQNWIILTLFQLSDEKSKKLQLQIGVDYKSYGISCDVFNDIPQRESSWTYVDYWEQKITPEALLSKSSLAIQRY